MLGLLESPWSLIRLTKPFIEFSLFRALSPIFSSPSSARLEREGVVEPDSRSDMPEACDCEDVMRGKERRFSGVERSDSGAHETGRWEEEEGKGMDERAVCGEAWLLAGGAAGRAVD